MNTETQTLILAGDGYKLSIATEAETKKTELLKESGKLTVVNDSLSSSTARGALKGLADMRRIVEKSRKQVKEPVIAVGKDIDAKAKEFVLEIDAEEARLKKLIGDYAMEVERKLREALAEERRKQAEREKAEREAEVKRQEAEEKAEAARKAAEAALWDESEEESTTAKQAEEDARRAKEEADRIAAENAVKEQEVSIIPEAVKGTKMEWDFEVLDHHALAASRPDFVTIKEKRSEVLSFLKGSTEEEDALIDRCSKIGIRAFKKSVVSTR